jgi:hypothetical protein
MHLANILYGIACLLSVKKNAANTVSFHPQQQRSFLQHQFEQLLAKVIAQEQNNEYCGMSLLDYSTTDHRRSKEDEACLPSDQEA